MAYKQVAPRTVIEGTTGASSFTAYSPVCAGTTSTGGMQDVGSLGMANDLLTSNGSDSLPAFLTPPIPAINWQLLTADPGSPAVGQVWYRTDTDEYKGYNGSIVTFSVS